MEKKVTKINIVLFKGLVKLVSLWVSKAKEMREITVVGSGRTSLQILWY